MTAEPVREAAATVPGALPKKRNSTEPVIVRVDAARSLALPAIGLGGAGLAELTEAERSRLRPLRLAHVRADLHLESPGWEAALERAAANARALEAPLEAALFLPDDPRAALADLAGRAGPLRPRVESWLLFRASDGVTADGSAALARQALCGVDPGARFGGGTDGSFVELNRRRPSLRRTRPPRLRPQPAGPRLRRRDARREPRAASAGSPTPRATSRAGSRSASPPSRCARGWTRAPPPRARRGSGLSPTTRVSPPRSRPPGRWASSPPPRRPASRASRSSSSPALVASRKRGRRSPCSRPSPTSRPGPGPLSCRARSRRPERVQVPRAGLSCGGAALPRQRHGGAPPRARRGPRWARSSRCPRRRPAGRRGRARARARPARGRPTRRGARRGLKPSVTSS